MIFNQLKILSVIIFNIASLHSQDSFYPSLRVGITPSAFINYYQAVQLSVDKRIMPRVNTEVELGYIYKSIFKAQGFRVRPGIEWLLASGKFSGVSLGLHYNYRWTVERRTLVRRDRSGEFTRIFYNQKRFRSYHGPMFSLKTIYRLGNRWTCDIGAAGGIARYRINEEMVPQAGDRFLENTDWLAIDEDVGLWILSNFHLNFSYVIR